MNVAMLTEDSRFVRESLHECCNHILVYYMRNEVILKTHIFRVVTPWHWVNSSNFTENTRRLYCEVQSVNVT